MTRAWLPALVAVAAVAAPAGTFDIRPWTAIGHTRLGMSEHQVERYYGRPVKRAREWIPVGTRYDDETVWRKTYAVPGGTLWVVYVKGRAHVVGTDSPRFSSARGLRVGARATGKSWHGFVPVECIGWYAHRRELAVILSAPLRGGRIAALSFGDPDVILPCF